MVTNDNDSRVRKTKKLIRKGLTQLAEQKSIYKITVKELTEEVDINRGTFYLHYKDIPDLVASIEKEMYRDFEEILATVTVASATESPIKLLEQFCVFLQSNAEICGVLLGEHGDLNFAFKFGDMMNDKVLELFWSLRPDLNKEVYDMSYEYCKYGVTGIIRCWFLEHPDWTPHKVALLWLRLISNGVEGVIRDNQKGVFN